MDSSAKIINIIALLCRKNNIDMAELAPLVTSQSSIFNPCEEYVANQLEQSLEETLVEVQLEQGYLISDQCHGQASNLDLTSDERGFEQIASPVLIADEQDSVQISDYDLIADDYTEFLDDDQDSSNHQCLHEPCDSVDFDEEDSVEFELQDNEDQDLNYVPPVQKCKSGSFTFEQGLQYFGYWTKQDKTTRPIEITQEQLDKPRTEKRPIKTVNNKFKSTKKLGTNLQNLRRWAKRVIEGGIGNMREINDFVYSKYKEQRKENCKHVHDDDLRKWALEAKDIYNPNMRFEATKSWAEGWKKKYRVVSRKITHRVNYFHFKTLF